MNKWRIGDWRKIGDIDIYIYIRDVRLQIRSGKYKMNQFVYINWNCNRRSRRIEDVINRIYERCQILDDKQQIIPSRSM